MAQPPIPQWFGAQPPPGAGPPAGSGAGSRLVSTLIVVAVVGGAVWYTRTLHQGARPTAVPSASGEAKLMAEREQLARQVAELQKSVAELQAKAGAGAPVGGDPLAVDHPVNPANPTHAPNSPDPLADDPAHATTPTPTPATTGAGLDAPAVRSGIVAIQPRAKQCFNDELKRNPTSQGRVQVAISIAPDGHVTSAHATSSGTLSNAMVGCVQTAASSAHFPASDGPTQVNVPFVFAGSG